MQDNFLKNIVILVDFTIWTDKHMDNFSCVFIFLLLLPKISHKRYCFQNHKLVILHFTIQNAILGISKLKSRSK